MKDFDEEIADIIAFGRDDTLAFNRLYQRYHKSVHANILKLVKCPEASVELLQDVFVSLWQNRDRIHQDRSVSSWLFVVSYNMSLNFIRKKVKESLVFVDEYPLDLRNAETSAAEDEPIEMQLQLLDEAVSGLPRRKQQVFHMCRYEGKSKKDVAELLGLSVRTVENYLKDANRMVKDYLWDKYPEQVGKIGVVLLTLYFV